MRVIVAVVAWLLGAALPAHAAAEAEAPTADRIEQARKKAISPELQPKLPRYDHGDDGDDGGGGSGDGTVTRDGSGGAGGTVDPKRSGRSPRGNVDRRGRDRIDTRERVETGGASGLMQVVMWGLLIVVAVLGAAWIASEFSKYGGDAELPASESQVRMQAAVDAIIDRPLGDADELARRGEYAEAIHTLLLRTLQELVRSAAVRVGPAMTSREILSRVPLLADARDALAGLITAVEITHFGDEPANAADYERCRQQFNVFAAAFRSAQVHPATLPVGSGTVAA